MCYRHSGAALAVKEQGENVGFLNVAGISPRWRAPRETRALPQFRRAQGSPKGPDHAVKLLLAAEHAQ